MKSIITKSLIIWLLLAGSAGAADHYASPTGSASWSNSTSVDTPCSITTAFANATTGDTVYLRGGTYAMGSSTLTTAHSGTGDADNQRVLITAYPSEIPTIIFTGVNEGIAVENTYWSLVGLSITGTTSNADAGIVRVGENNDGSYLKIDHCTITLTSSTNSQDNISTISLQAYRSNYALITNNTLVASTSPYSTCVIQYLGGLNVGTKILNNDISGGSLGIYIKHRNADTAETGAEIAYNYIHNVLHGFYGNPQRINFHDNLVQGINIGDNGGGTAGNTNTINHNTVYGTYGLFLWSPSEGLPFDNNFTNNIFYNLTNDSGSGDPIVLQIYDYNMWEASSALGVHDIGNTTPTYTGGSNPSTIAGYALATGSAGYLSGSDGKSIGADISLVGIDATYPDPTCSDGIQNGDETGIDCGGSCPACSGGAQTRTRVHMGITPVSVGSTAVQ